MATSTIEPFKHHVLIGYVPEEVISLQSDGWVFVTIEWSKDKTGRLSIRGVVGPFSNGNARGSCGQCIDSVRECTPLAPFTVADRDKLAEIWDRWHLNDARAGCEHQRKDWDVSEKLEVVSYGLTTEAYQLRNKTLVVAAQAALKGEAFNPAPTERALAEMEDWFQERYVMPPADSPLAGCFQEKKREQKLAGWTYEREHPKGLLSKPCPTCGYKYGNGWLHEDVPDDVLAWLKNLPTTDNLPACWQR